MSCGRFTQLCACKVPLGDYFLCQKEVDSIKQDAFSRYHPAVNFLYFVLAIGFGVVFQHPAYMTAATLGSAVYYLLLKGRKGIKMICLLLPVFLLIGFVNPLFNTLGETELFLLFGRPYTLEALYYGFVVGGIFVVMMLWFGCYNVVLTSDKFTSLFGNLIPALSLLLVMVLRMIPSLMNKAVQISGARKSIGKTVESGSKKESVKNGMTVLSALTDWALEGSIITADSMRCRGYGAAKRTNFQIYRMTTRDGVLLALTVLFGAVTMLADKTAEFIPTLQIAPISWHFGVYCLFLLLPTVLHLKEAITWRILRSKI